MLTSLTLTYFYGQPSTVMPATVQKTPQGATPLPGASQTPVAPIPAPAEQQNTPAAPAEQK
jgi:hypothetical protein